MPVEPEDLSEMSPEYGRKTGMKVVGQIRAVMISAALMCGAPISAAGELPNQGGDQSASDAPAQLPRLLDGYAARPSWQVAGVDYAVGVHPGITLKIPTANNLPPGASLQKGPAIYIDGNNVKLDGYDLSSFTVMINDGASGTVTISNCAGIGVNIRSTVGATASLDVQYCSLDGGGTKMDPNFQLIKVWCPQTTVEYSLIAHAPGGIYAPAQLTVRYNVIKGMGLSASGGGHANAIYVTGTNNPADTTTIAYNTIYSEDARTASGFPIGLGAAIGFFGDGGSFHNSTVANNTMISALPGGASYLIGYYVGGSESATGASVHDNYVASLNGFNQPNSGAFGAFTSSGNVTATYANNIDMNNGKTINGNNARTGSSGSSAAPTITGFSTGSGRIGDGISNDNRLVLRGSAAANSVVKVFDGGNQIGRVKTGNDGLWTFDTIALTDGGHEFTAAVTSGGITSVSSSLLSVTVDTLAPKAPVFVASARAGSRAVVFSGTSEANTVIKIFDGVIHVGTTTADNNGAWIFTIGQVAAGGHRFTARAIDSAGNTSVVSSASVVTVSASAAQSGAKSD